MNLPHIKDQSLSGQTVLVRADLDLPAKDTSRLTSMFETLEFLLNAPAKIILIGHLGRPQGAYHPDLSLSSLSNTIHELSRQPVSFIPSLDFAQIKTALAILPLSHIAMLENLRFSPDEEGNDIGFAHQLASLASFYCNEAFASSHRPHASIVSIPKLLPHATGFHFAKEVDNLSLVLKNPARPLVFVLSGVKSDKLDYLPAFQKIADQILIGGRLPELKNPESKDKTILATLTSDKLDIDQTTIGKFQNILGTAKTIILCGPLGKFEDPLHEQGTKEIFQTIASSQSFKIAGGGDTIAAISKYQLQDKFNWISTGGGAMLEFLAHGTLPGISALLL